MKVLKFGGTSVSSVETVKNISAILKRTTEKQIIVCSALSKVTNMLTEAAEKAASGDISYREISAQIEKRHYDFIDELIAKDQQNALKERIHNYITSLDKVLEAIFFLNELSQRAYYIIVSFGEKMSNAIIYRYLQIHNGNVDYLDSSQIIITRTVNGKEHVNRTVTFDNIRKNWNQNADITVAPGFISKSEKGYATTLGRGGSDYTAALYAAALDASILEIWTDVSGIYTSDPRKVAKAYPLEKVSYREALELSNFGAKVIYAPTIQPVLEKNIPMVILNTFRPDDKGTLVTAETSHDIPIKAISTMDNIAMITFSGTGLVGTTGIAGRLFSMLSHNNINITIICQASSEMSICLVIDAKDADKAVKAINEEFDFEIRKDTVNKTTAETDFAIVAMVGEGMKNSAGLTGKAFTALGNAGINIHAIVQDSTEVNVSIIVKKDDATKALNVLHDAFFNN
jgi:aspartokinase/homoserine dehydrogenase 1